MGLKPLDTVCFASDKEAKRLKVGSLGLLIFVFDDLVDSKEHTVTLYEVLTQSGLEFRCIHGHRIIMLHIICNQTVIKNLRRALDNGRR